MNHPTKATLSDLLEASVHAFSVGDDGSLNLKKEYASSLWARISMGTIQGGWLVGSLNRGSKVKYRMTLEFHNEAPEKLVIRDELGRYVPVSIKDMFQFFPDTPIDPLFIPKGQELPSEAS